MIRGAAVACRITKSTRQPQAVVQGHSASPGLLFVLTLTGAARPVSVLAVLTALASHPLTLPVADSIPTLPAHAPCRSRIPHHISA